MGSSSKFAEAVVTPTKPKSSPMTKSKINLTQKCSENFDPNVSSPGLKISKSPSVIKARKSVSRKPNPIQFATPSPKTMIRQRKFVVAKKTLRKEDFVTSEACKKCEKANGKSKCLCVAYQNLRASQEDFFKARSEIEDDIAENPKTVDESNVNGNYSLSPSELGLKRSRDKFLEEARKSVPDTGSGRVMHLVKVFEKLRMMPKPEASETETDEEMKWALPGLHQHPQVEEDSSSSLCPSDLFLTSESLGLDSRHSFSSDSSQGSASTTSGGRESRPRNTRKHGKQKQKKATSQKPFALRTEQRGKCKEEEFMKKLQQMMEEEEKLRIPIAQALPLTTDEPEVLIKPPVKEITRPMEVLLHSDTRAMGRAEFDQQVCEKMNLMEEYRAERERQFKQDEEEEIRKLRKELVPKAQPMPYFDRPFIPIRSTRNPTVPKEPKFHLPQHKKMKGRTDGGT